MSEKEEIQKSFLETFKETRVEVRKKFEVNLRILKPKDLEIWSEWPVERH